MNQRTSFTGVDRARKTKGNAPIGLNLTRTSKMSAFIDVNHPFFGEMNAFMSVMNAITILVSTGTREMTATLGASLSVTTTAW